MLGAALGMPAILPGRVHATPADQTLRIGLIGCGGRGTGAAAQALKADPRVELTALGDVFEDRLRGSLQTLQASAEAGQRVRVAPDHCFVGFDAYEKVIHSGVDVVLLAAPPGFRPQHLAAAVAAGKHVFAEKPMAVDGPGVRSVLASAALAREKNLALVSGFCFRYHNGVRALMAQIHEGAIGDMRAIHTAYNTGLVWARPRQAGWTDMEWQMCNWYYFTWLSGDHIVEQACHNLDKMAWAMRDVPPLRCSAVGGRQVRTGEEHGHIYDHFGVVYEYENGVRAFHFCRQMANTASDVSDYFMGSDGIAHIVRAMNGPFVIRGKNTWRYRDAQPSDMYQTQHDELFASIRRGQPINDGVCMAHSTLLGVMGRMAAYTGQVVTWEEALNSREDLMPPQLSWDAAIAVPPVAMPGITRVT